jgi:hypothetical protein
VRALRDQAAVVQDENPVRVPYGGEPMGDDERGPSTAQAAQRVEDHFLRNRVE